MKKLIFLTLLAAAACARADHGPGTSGAGAFTESAETLKPGHWSATVKFDWTEFDVPGASTLAGKEAFDFLERSFLTTLSLGLGVTENFQLGLSFGYYAAEGAGEIATVEGGERERITFDPDGWTDLWLTGKLRIYRGPAGQVALYAGVKAPVGETRIFNSAGERIEPASSPGSGAWDGMVGAAYTQSLTPSLALDASVQYTMHGEKFNYRLGNRLDAGVALGWRIVGGAKDFPQVSLQAEANVRAVDRSRIARVRADDTGGTVLFLSPGVRVRFCEHSALSVGVQVPVVQDLHGDQLETSFRFTTSVNISF